jgi:hypothetical protein
LKVCHEILKDRRGNQDEEKIEKKKRAIDAKPKTCWPHVLHNKRLSRQLKRCDERQCLSIENPTRRARGCPNALHMLFFIKLKFIKLSSSH